MLRLKHQRKNKGKDTEFMRNGKPIQLDRYLQRVRGPNPQIASPGETLGLPSSLRFRTPPPQPSIYRFQQLISAVFRGMLLAYPDPNERNWVKNEIDYDMFQAVNDIVHGTDLIYGLVGEGHIILRRGFSKIHQIVDENSTQNVMSLYFKLHRRKYWDDEIIKKLWQYLKSYSIASNRQSQPMYGLFETLVEVCEDPSVVAWEIINATEANLYEQLKTLGFDKDPVLMEEVRPQVTFDHSLSGWKDLGSAILHQATSVTTGRYDAGDCLTWRLLQLEVKAVLDGPDSQDTMRLADDIIEDMIRRYPEGANIGADDLIDRCRFIQAYHHYQKWSESPDRRNPRLETAIVLLRGHVSYVGERYRVGGYLLRALKVLEDWERCGGLTEEAHATSVRYDGMLQEFRAMSTWDV